MRNVTTNKCKVADIFLRAYISDKDKRLSALVYAYVHIYDECSFVDENPSYIM